MVAIDTIDGDRRQLAADELRSAPVTAEGE